jgi:nicotinamide-nucleotide amidase
MAGDAPGDRLGELAQALQAHCLDVGATVALAESCTGGMVASALTDIAGSSGYLLGGVVAYSDAAKRELLGVDPAVLAAHGAVSAQVARDMAIAARERFAATIGASVTGIAGPGGATASKPIDGAGAAVRRIVWSGDRAANRHDSAVLVLEALLERLDAPMPAPANDQIRA